MVSYGLKALQIEGYTGIFRSRSNCAATADLMGIQVNTVALFYRKIRIVIAENLEAEASEFVGEVELDESYSHFI